MIRRLLFLNGIAILGVVLFHSSGMGFVAMFAWASRYLPPGASIMDQVGSLSYYGLRMVEQIAIVSIPAFLFVSGNFVAVSAGRDATMLSRKLIYSRIQNLLIPYFLWSVVVIALNMITGSKFSEISVLIMLLTGGANEIFYFVPLLVQFYLLSPLLIRIARANPLGLLIVCGVIQTFLQLLPYHVLFDTQLVFVGAVYKLIPKWLFISRIFWFPLGMVAGLHSPAIKQTLVRLRNWAIAAAIILVPLGILEWETLFRRSGEIWLAHRETVTDNLYSLAVLISLLALRRIPANITEPFESLGAKSYGIFLTHGIFIEYTAKVIYHAAPALLGYQIALQPVFVFIGLAGPLAIITLIDHSVLRKAYSYLYG